jgi:predicted dehydrogenase
MGERTTGICDTQLRLGVIGIGGRGGLWRYWHQPQGRSVVVGAADVDPAQLAAFQKEHGGAPFVTGDYRALLERKDVDAIAVTSPDFCHEEQAVAALEAGKHVFCEKPLAITIAGCDHILSTAQRTGHKLMVGFNMRYMAIFRTMKEILNSGAIGEVKAVWVRHFVGFGGDFYYHDWHARRQNTTSLMLQKGSHDIDMVHWLTGRYTTRVAAFGGLDYFGGDKPNDLRCPTCPDRETCIEAQDPAATRQQCAFRQEVDVEDNSTVIMQLEGGIKASYLQCHFTPDYHRNYVLIGTEGRIENSEPEMKVWVKTRRTHTWRSLADRTYDIKPAQGSHSGADPVITRDFCDMVLDGKEPEAPAIAGRMSVAVGCQAAESMRHGGMPLDVPAYGG